MHFNINAISEYNDFERAASEKKVAHSKYVLQSGRW